MMLLQEEFKLVNQIGLKICCIGSGDQHQSVCLGIQYQSVCLGVQYQNGFCIRRAEFKDFDKYL